MSNDKLPVLIIYVGKGVLHFIPLLAFGHLIPEAQSANFIIGISVFGLLVPLFDFGYRIYIFRYFTRSSAFQTNDAHTGIFIKTILLGVSLSINFSIGTWDTSVAYLPYIFAAYFASLANHFYFFIGATTSFAKEAQGFTTYAVLLCAATLGVWWYNGNYAYIFLIASIAYCSIAAVHFLGQSERHVGNKKQTHVSQFLILMPYTIHVYVSVGVGLGDNLFLSLFADQSTVIQYSVFLRVFLITNFLTSPFVQVITPQISLAVKEERYSFLRKRLFHDLLIAGVFAVAMGLAYPFIVSVLFPDYKTSILGVPFAFLFACLAFSRFASLSASVIVTMMGNQWFRVYILGFFTLTGYGLYYLFSDAGVMGFSLILLYMVMGTSLVYGLLAFLSIQNR